MRTTAVRLLAATTLLATAACDGGSTGPDRLTPAEVGGVYRICTLRFVPENTAIAPANLLDRVVNVTPPPGKPEPTLTLSPSLLEYELIYTRKSDSFTQQLRGRVEYGTNEAVPRFYSDPDARGAIGSELLLSARPTLVFQTGPRRLTSTAIEIYSVSRRDYAAAAGVSESGFNETIRGRMEMSLREGSCS